MASAAELLALGQMVNGPTRGEQLATLKPYEPTWRDRLASALMGDERASPERRRFVEGLLGSTGLGTTGPAVVDFVPGGQVLGAQEAMSSQDPAGNLALSIMPGGIAAKGAMPAVKEGAKETAKVIKAYHGSPHDFEKFDLSKIGTGEGAQAYGHGLYFAENEGVARAYRESLANDVFIDGKPASAIDHRIFSSGAEKTAFFAVKDAVGDVEKAIAYAESAGGEKAAAIVRKWAADGKFQPPGRMYEVAIHADPERFLDWDRPLNQQGDAVRGFVADLEKRRKAELANVDPSQFPDYASFEKAHGANLERAAKLRVNPGWTGSQLYESSKLVPGDFRDPTAATAALREAGIPGIKYLDQGSRKAGDGSRNYVLFDDSIVEILRKYGVASIAALPPAVQLMLMGQADGQDAR